MDVDAFLNPPRAARRGPPRARPGRRRGRLRHRRPAVRAEGARRHPGGRARVLAANPKVRFVCIGDGILRDRLIAELERLGIRDAFIFTGLVPPDRIPELLQAVDAVIHPSLREGLARVLPQALLVGRPVISYDVDGAREVVLPETGILLSPRDLDGLVAAILRLAADPDAPDRDGRGRAPAVRRPVPPRDDDRPAPVTLRAAAREPRLRAVARSGPSSNVVRRPP